MSTAMDTHIQDFTDAFCAPNIDFIPVHQIVWFCEKRGIDIIVFLDGFMEKHPSWFRHRFDKGIQLKKGGPAQQHVGRFASGVVAWEEWSRDGWEHRDDGPAEIRYDERGNIIFEAWWRNGEQYTPSAHDRLAWAAAQRREGGE